MYSRPGTSQVNALARVPTPMSVDVGGAPRSVRTADGRLYDNRNPNTVLQNGQARTAEITNFIEGLTKVATPLIKDQLTQQANRQVGELLATQDPVQLLRSSDADQQAIVRNLSPQAQDLLAASQAKAAVRLYQDTHLAERTKRKAVLEGIGVSETDRLEAATAAQSEALNASGIARVKPSYLAEYAPIMAETDALLQGVTYKARAKAQDDADRDKYIAGLQSDLFNFLPVLKQYREAGQTEAFVNDARKTLETEFENASSRYLGKDQAENWAKAVTNETLRLTSAGEYGQAMEFLQMMQGLSVLDVKTPSGALFFKQELDSGVTLERTIGELLDKTRGSYKEWQKEQILEQNKDALIRGLRGEDIGPEIDAAISDPNLSFQEAFALSSAASSASELGQKPTQAQLLNEADLRYELAQGINDPQEMWRRIQGSDLTARQKLGLAGAVVKGPDETTRLISGVRSYMGQETKEAARGLARIAGLSGDEADNLERKLTNDVTKRVEQRYAEKVANGETVDETVLREMWRTEMDAEVERRTTDREERLKIQQMASPKTRVSNELKEFKNNVMSSKGEVTIMTFPKQVRVDFSNQFPNKKMTPEALGNYMIQRMKSVREDDKDVFPDAQKTVRQIIDHAQGRTPRATSDGKLIPPTKEEMLLGKHGVEAWRMLQSWMRPTTAAKPEAPKPAASPTATKPETGSAVKPQQVSAKPQQSGPVQVVAQALGAVANVFTPPAAAMELKGPSEQDAAAQVENSTEEAVRLLNRAWNRQQPADIRTPPLPQVSSSAQVGQVSLAINHDKHPMFVAIGIAEGTRTANGGYTSAYRGHRDPGDGHWNRGTVSGGRGGSASPAQVDRQWMARLTQTATRTAPTLQRVGLQPGTQGYNRVMFNVLDLTVQAPAAVGDFLRKLPTVVQQGASVEAIAKARSDSFINPRTGRLDTSFGSYNRLFQDQRSRAGVWDYRRRI